MAPQGAPGSLAQGSWGSSLWKCLGEVAENTESPHKQSSAFWGVATELTSQHRNGSGSLSHPQEPGLAPNLDLRGEDSLRGAWTPLTHPDCNESESWSKCGPTWT
jgi:hypothetical protein